MREVGVKSNPVHVQIALCIAVFLVPFMGSSLNLALPLIAGDFTMSAFSLTFIVSGYLVGTSMFQMPAARVSDILGRRRMFILGLSLFGLFTLLSGFAWSGTALIVFRFLSGVGSAFVFATNMAILTSVFPKEKRGAALGVNTSVVYFSVAIGPFLGGLLAHHFGWRSIIYVTTGVTVLAIIAAVVTIKDEWVLAKGEPYDTAGAGLYSIAVAALVFGFSLLPLAVGWFLVLVAAVGTCLFIRTENRIPYPMLKVHIFKENRHFRLASLSAMINYSASFAIGFILSLYLQYVIGMTPDRAGLVLIAQPVTQTLLAPVGGWLSDRVNPSILTTGGMGAITVGLFFLSYLTPTTSMWYVVAILVLVGIGFAMFSPPNANIIMSSVSRRDSGLASATTGTARQIGQSMSIAMTSLIIHHYMGRNELTRETAEMFLPAMQTGFLIFAAICLVGCYTSASKLLYGGHREQWRHQSVRTTARSDAHGDGVNDGAGSTPGNGTGDTSGDSADPDDVEAP